MVLKQQRSAYLAAMQRTDDGDYGRWVKSWGSSG